MKSAVYNLLPDSITAAPTTKSFKNNLKNWLIEQSFYEVDGFSPN